MDRFSCIDSSLVYQSDDLFGARPELVERKGAGALQFDIKAVSYILEDKADGRTQAVSQETER